MATPHKHAELIKAWADGAEIEFYDSLHKGWKSIAGPITWAPTLQYRIKPAKQWYRVALKAYSDKSFYTVTAESVMSEQNHERSKTFVRWLTERIEYEV